MQIKETIYKNLSRLMPKSGSRSSAAGLDIGNFSVKAVKLKGQNTPAVSALGMEEIKNGNIKEAVKAALTKAGIAERKVNIGISGKQTVVRCVVVPEMQDADFRNSLKYEAAKYIPFAANEVILDSVVLTHNIEANKMLVLIAAAKKDFIEQRLQLISDLGLEPSVLDIDSLALINIFNLSKFQIKSAPDQPGHPAEILALLNIGSHLSNLSFLENGLLRFNRDIIFGGDAITKKIGSALGIDFEKAEKIKLSPNAPQEVQAVIEASLLDLVNELRLSFDYYESQTGKTAGRVYLSGGGACLSGIDRFLHKSMNIPFETWNSFIGLKLDGKLEQNLPQINAPYFAVALGLSLR